MRPEQGAIDGAPGVDPLDGSPAQSAPHVARAAGGPPAPPSADEKRQLETTREATLSEADVRAQLRAAFTELEERLGVARFHSLSDDDTTALLCRYHPDVARALRAFQQLRDCAC